MINNIYLTGFMGSGKSSVGRALARILKRPFLDLDQVLEERLGQPISSVFETHGEERFRAREREFLTEIAQVKGAVAATGGGTPVSEENRALMRETGLIVHLRTHLETCQARVGRQAAGTRPMWQDPEAVRRLYESRAGAYADNDLEIDGEQGNPDQVARAAAARVVGQDSFEVNLGGTPCQVQALLDAPGQAAKLAQGRRVFVLTDRNVARLHLERYTERLKDPRVMIVPGGERIKTLATLKRIYDRLLDLKFNRDDLFLALGGGAVTDLGAFAAATYKRGMGLVLASTSLLGCVDAAVGGKAAVNAGQAKNVIGAFTVPETVLLDLSALGTLKTPGLREGLVEAYKTGLVASPELAGLIASDTQALLRGDLPGLARVAALSARAKAGVVSRDFREGNLRMILNLGHTYGHAVEAWHNYRVSHGLAVGAGLLAALELSCQRGLLDRAGSRNMAATVRAVCGKLPALPSLDQAWPIMEQDKKIKQGKVIFVLLKGMGEPVIVNDLEPGELDAALAALEKER